LPRAWHFLSPAPGACCAHGCGWRDCRASRSVVGTSRATA
jgi:hypothetical protein